MFAGFTGLTLSNELYGSGSHVQDGKIQKAGDQNLRACLKIQSGQTLLRQTFLPPGKTRVLPRIFDYGAGSAGLGSPGSKTGKDTCRHHS